MKENAICFVTTGDLRTLATGKRALGLASPLSDLGWRVSVLLQDTEENRHRAELETDGRTRFEFFPSGSAIQEVERKNDLLERLAPTHIYLCAFVLRNLVRTRGARMLIEHSELLSAIKSRPWHRRLCDALLEWLSLLYADGLLNASEYLHGLFCARARLLRRASLQQLHFPYACPDALIDWQRGHPRCDTPGKVFLFMGSIRTEYGALEVVEAFRRVLVSYPASRLVMVGVGPQYDALRDAVLRYGIQGKVETPGYVPEEQLPEWLSRADCFVSPMHDTVQDWARCPSKLYYYLAYGKPIITCRVGEPFDTLGNAGFYYEPSDVEGMAEQMRQVCGLAEQPTAVAPRLHSWSARAALLDQWLRERLPAPDV